MIIPCAGCGVDIERRSSGHKYCEPCGLEAKRETKRAGAKRWRAKHPEAVKAQRQAAKERRANDPEYRERCNAWWRNYYHTHPEYNAAQRSRANKRATLQYQTDEDLREYHRAYGRERYRTDPEFRMREDQRSLARKRKLESPDEETIQFMLLLKTDPCSYCGNPGETIDHIHPVSKGGANHWTNMTSACRSCNASKHNRTDLLVWMLAPKRWMLSAA